MQLFSSNLLSVPIAPNLDGSSTDPLVEFGLKYCPSMDMIAVYPRYVSLGDREVTDNSVDSGTDINYAEEDEEELVVDVYRLSGQKVFTTTIELNTAKAGIIDVAWRDDGIILAIATSDNRIRLVDTFSGKVVHTFNVATNHSIEEMKRVSGSSDDTSVLSGKRRSLPQQGGPRKRRCTPKSLHYSTHFSNPDAARQQLIVVHEQNGRVLDDLLSLHADIDELLKLEADLPKELASIDAEQYLPKLATLPASGLAEDAVFSTRVSIDSLFHASKQNARSSSIDIVTVALNDASVHVRIFDSFEVGGIDLNTALNLPAGCILGNVKITTHPFSEKVYVLANEQVDSNPNKPRRHARPEVANVGRLHLLSLDLRFLQQSSVGLPVLATKATQLHNLIRYLRQIEQQLAREIKSAFDLPSRFIRTLEEDLKEQDGDGSTFQTSAYHSLLTGEVSGKFKEWLVDILGERGVKRWEKAVAECLDNVRRSMNENWNPAVERAGVVVSRLMGLAASGAFHVDKMILEGLRNTIDVMAIIGEDLVRDVNVEIAGFTAFMTWLKREVEAASLEDTSEKLEEMREGSDHSETRKILKYISERLQDTTVKRYIRDDQGTDNAAGKQEDDVAFYKEFRGARRNIKDKPPPPSMKLLHGRLRTQCDRLFSQVAQQLRENILVEHICALTGSWDVEALDCQIVFVQDHPVLNIFAMDSENRGTLRVTQRPLGQTRDNSKNKTIALDDTKEILDIKCADEETVFVLVRATEAIKILSIRLHGDFDFEVSPRHVFGGGQDSFIKLGLNPWRMDVNGRKGRRTITILDRQGRGYGVFDLDSTATDQGTDDAEMKNG